MAAKKNTTKKKTQTKKTTTKKNNKSLPKKKASTKPVAKKSEPTELDKVLEQVPADQREQLEHIRDSLDKFKTKLLAKLEGYIMGISLLPPDKDDEKKEKVNVLVLVDDKDSNKMPKHELQEKVQGVVDDIAKQVDESLSVEALLLTDLWGQCYDAKYDVLQLIAMGATVYDTGMMAAIKISEVHKNMALKKFEKYIVSYVLSGSLVQGKATPQSDIDVWLVIDDTDVKKMTRVELKDKLRSIIMGMGAEAGQMTGIQNKINIQVYILTDFWESLKDANPVMFTLLRDGVPFYDRGVFMPWKQLLQMGRIKPSPEAIEMFMQSGWQFMDRIHAKIRDIVMEDLFWALLTPSQAALMMFDVPPTTPKETPDAMRSILVKKEKLLEAEYVKTLEDVLKIRKDIEHGTKKDVTGKEMDDLVKRSGEFLKRIDKLFNEIDDKKHNESVLNHYENIVTILRDALRLEGIEKVDEKNIYDLFNEHLIKKGYLPHQIARELKTIFDAKKHFDANKLSKQEVGLVNKQAKDIVRILVEHIQRKRGRELERTKIRVKYGKDKYGEVILLGDRAFIVHDLDSQEKEVTTAKITKFGTFIDKQESNLEQLEEAIMAVTMPPKVFIKGAIFEDLKAIFGKDVEILVNY